MQIKFYESVEDSLLKFAVMYERFGKDSIISLPTCFENVPYVRKGILYSHGTRYDIDFRK